MLFASGRFHDRVDMDQLFIKPFLIALQKAIGTRGARVDFAAHQRGIELRPGKARDEPGLGDADDITEQPRFVVGGETHGLSSDSDFGRCPKFFQTVETSLLSAYKDRMVGAVSRA